MKTNEKREIPGEIKAKFRYNKKCTFDKLWSQLTGISVEEFEQFEQDLKDGKIDLDDVEI